MILNSPLAKISYQVPFQFPSLYREEAATLISLVQSYYEFLENNPNQGIYQSRRLPDTIDIDRTMQDMLIFYQKKYLPDLPVNDQNIRFLVKNITDLYRRKGSEEGLHLFFRMFYDANIEVYYPSKDMLKPSWSQWKRGDFIQLYPIVDPLELQDLPGSKIYGSLSQAEAYVDDVQFVTVSNQFIPVVFLDKTHGSFIGLETIFVTEPERKSFGRIYGSLTEINSIVGKTANNKVGDVVTIQGELGVGGRAIVTKVSDTISGEIAFKIVDGDFGYTTAVFDDLANTYITNTHIILSNQNLIIDNPDLVFIEEERVGQEIAANTWIYATVIGQNETTLGIRVEDDEVLESNSWFTADFPIETIDRDVNIQKNVILANMGQIRSKAASAYVGEISNTMEIDIVTDIIEDYLDVQLGPDTNYNDAPADQPMSGNTDPINLSTQLIDAFGPQQITIGTISKLIGVDVGSDYVNNIFALVKEDRIMRFDIKDFILSYNSANTPIIITEGDIITQERVIYDFEGNETPVTITGKVVKIENDALYVKPRTVYDYRMPFVNLANNVINTPPIYKKDTTVPIDVISIGRDDSSKQMGYNAIISAEADFELGRIESLKVINSGIAYQDGEALGFRNKARWERDLASAQAVWDADETPEGDRPTMDDIAVVTEAEGIAYVRGQGVSEGYWATKSSHVGFNDGKRIQDSNFYQDFSYEIASSLREDTFKPHLLEVVHPAGVKLFTKFSVLEEINITTNITSEITEEPS